MLKTHLSKKNKVKAKSNVRDRLLLCCIGIPILIVIILLPFLNQVLMNILLIVFIAMGSYEMAKLLNLLSFPVQKLPAVLIGLTLPILSYLESTFLLLRQYNCFSFFTIVLILSSLSLPGLLSRKEMKYRVHLSIGYLLIILYPGFLGSYISKISSYDNGPLLCLLFFASVQANDSFAWVFGVLFGKTRGFIDVSPNKSLEGFISGVLGSLIAFAVFSWIWPKVLALSWQIVFLSLIICFAVILGDLVESLLKRAAGVKDSGSFIRGRGGVLDSIDSLLFVAPLYYYFLPFII